MSVLRDELQRTLGASYTLERELGGGGMSSVFVARDNALGRAVVIKVLPLELAATVSVVVSALIFSGFHYVGALGDTFTVASFTFRAIAGVAFSVLYVTRGFGVTAWTHALYDLGISLLQT